MGNNGRDCIQQASRYDYNLLNCFFQNDNLLYSPNQYLTGVVTTTGISRYNNKFDFLLQAGPPFPDITFTLTPKYNADFSYAIQMDGNVCPQVLHQVSLTSGCLVTLYYRGSQTVTFYPTASSSNNPITASFISNSTQNVSIPLDTWSVSVAGRDCFILSCQFTIEFSIVKLTTPNVEIISAADRALQTQVQFSIDKTIAQTVAEMDNVIQTVSVLNANISILREQLAALDFNVSKLYPYENFTQMRADLDALINRIPTSTDNSESSPSTRNCDGPWNSVSCWFQDFASTLITIAIVAGVVLLGYIIFVKMGLAKKIFGKKKKTETKAEPMTEYRAD
jgi:hypothetical protein